MTADRRARALHRGASGAATVDFVLVGLLVTALFAGLLQIGFDLHIRNVLQAAAADGARFGANADATPGEGAAQANALIASSLGPGYAHASAEPDRLVDGQPVVVITVRDRLPLIAGWLPAVTVTVTGQALAEP
jgi:Flp pilus assembly protein TadG